MTSYHESKLVKQTYKSETMKNKTILSWLVNPFTHIAGGKAVLIGLGIQLLTVFIGNLLNIHFDGALDIHGDSELTLIQDFYLWGLGVASIIILMYISGLILAKGFRFIDLLGTVLIARTPYIINVIAISLIEMPSTETIMADPMSIFTSTSMIALMSLSIIMILVLIWHFTLLYNAYKVSTGLSGNKVVASFIVVIILAEILSKVLIFYLMSPILKPIS